MKQHCKTGYILLDGDDLTDFRESHGYSVSEATLLVPFSFTTIMQMVMHEEKSSYYIPCVPDDHDCSFLGKMVYEKSKKFLNELLLANKVIDNSRDSLPLEFFWFRLWSGVYRVISLCRDFLDRYSVEEIVLIRRHKLINRGGLLIDLALFADLVESFMTAANIKVKLSEDNCHYSKPQTIFYGTNINAKSLLKHLIKFTYWKTKSFSKKNYDHILIKPAYDNTISSYNTFKNSGRNVYPQIFHGNMMPFLHSWKRMIAFFLSKRGNKANFLNTGNNKMNSHEVTFCDFKFDAAKIFQSTIEQYLKDVNWMNSYIDMFWGNCLSKDKGYLTIFSLPPVHLDSYFLAQKTKESGGKTAHWQHGGLYGYTDHFFQYVEDYKDSDYFLAYGKRSIKKTDSNLINGQATCVQVGSKVIYSKPNRSFIKSGEQTKLNGLFIPVVIGSFCSPSFIKWNGKLQFNAIKDILDFFGSDEKYSVTVKGFKGHKPHDTLRKYLQVRKYDHVLFSDIPLNKALSKNPDYVVLDNPSTPLLQTLAQYNGPIFLLVNQESWTIIDEALDLLKRRVVYSESVDELKIQLKDHFKTGSLVGADTKDTSFVETYIKPFCVQEYEHFLQEAIKTCLT